MFFVVKRKKVVFWLVTVLIVTVLCVLNFSNGLTEAIALANSKKIPVYSVETKEKRVVLSFDAAWGADKTQKIMDIADEYGVKVTFFMVGFWVDKYPEMVKEIHARGHLLGNHSANHLHMSKLSAEDITMEITTTNEKIEALTGYKPVYFRAPFGEYNDALMQKVEELDMVGVQWDVDSLDWKGLSAAQIAERVLPKIKQGSIVLCHNNSDHIVEALPIILMGIKNKGYSAVRMDELVHVENFVIDNNGLQKQINIQ